MSGTFVVGVMESQNMRTCSAEASRAKESTLPKKAEVSVQQSGMDANASWPVFDSTRWEQNAGVERH
jgi:hypothetical protein